MFSYLIIFFSWINICWVHLMLKWNTIQFVGVKCISPLKDQFVWINLNLVFAFYFHSCIYEKWYIYIDLPNSMYLLTNRNVFTEKANSIPRAYNCDSWQQKCDQFPIHSIEGFSFDVSGLPHLGGPCWETRDIDTTFPRKVDLLTK